MTTLGMVSLLDWAESVQRPSLNREAVLRLLEAHSREAAMGEDLDAAGGRVAADRDSEHQLVAVGLIDGGLADGEAEMAMGIRGPVLGAGYPAIRDQRGQALGGRTGRLVGLAGATVGILDANQVELVPRVLHLDQLELILPDVGGGVEDTAA